MKTCQALIATLALTLICQQPLLAQVSEQEIERREAAAGFLLPMAAGLGVLRLECSQWLKGDEDITQVARAWWERNRASLDAAIWVTAQSVRRYRATMSPDKAAVAEREIAQGAGDATLANLRTIFARQLPTPELCQRAIQTYKFKELDVTNLAKTPGYEKFGEFGETLKRVLADQDFRPMDEKFRTFDAQVAIASTPLITLDAIEAAKTRGDVSGVVQGFESLVERGNARAAQTLGVYYLNGQYVPRNPQTAQGWFYNAWAMGDAAGINALGVMSRDAIGVPANKSIALAAFAVARQMTAKKGPAETYHQSQSNYSRLSQQMSPAEVVAVGCVRWSDLHDKLRHLAEASGVKLVAQPGLPSGNLFDSNTLNKTQSQDTSCSG